MQANGAVVKKSYYREVVEPTADVAVIREYTVFARRIHA